MAVLIENQNNVFYAKGEINQLNAKILKMYIESQFRKFNRVILNINDVSKIDKSGISILTSLYYTSISRGKSFSIIGYGCKDIYDEFLLSA
ncbi:STAS domain-containing protein [Pseudotenacibaculum sp. MALMAid0570]|uniref:STAS domain-containing protein n=1 Tax=Pseudotenacibaculum sp. MALMAid0570 TaxID=3143938 RepID=UPI0032DF0004